MSVWYCIPSKRQFDEAELVLAKWRERGYKIALWVDSALEGIQRKMILKSCDLVLGTEGPYPGYTVAVNALMREVLKDDAEAEWLVTGGDDVEPDPNYTAEQIAEQCSEHFANLHQDSGPGGATFGVMQPTGDRWGDDAHGRARWPTAPAYIDRVLGSPWFGREYVRRMYGGNGPLCQEYTHMFEDEEAQNVALKLGVLWQRRDLTHYHNHWGRGGDQAACPEFLRHVAGDEHWAFSKAIFERRQREGYPGHEPIL